MKLPATLPGKMREFGRHLVVATVIASAVHVFAHTGYLNWLETLSLRMSTVAAPRVAARDGVEALPDTPVVLAVGNGMFETTFRQESPLDRGILTAILGNISRLGPRLLVVDLDLSPGPGGAPDPVTQQELDTTVVRLAQERKVRIVLAAPLPVESPSLRSEKFAWMQKMCTAGVVFAQTDLTLSQAAVLRYDEEGDGLGQTAARVWRQPDRYFRGALCDQVEAGERYAVFLSTMSLALPAAYMENFGRQRPIESTFLRSAAAEPHLIESAGSESIPPGLAGRAVFLGANFNASEHFLTAWGERPGLSVHAAIFMSELHPIAALSARVSFLIDILIGALAGALFHFTWHCYAAAERNIHSEAGNPWRPYLATRLWLAGNFALLFCVVLAFFYWSGLMFRFNLWVNPGPILLGVFLKNLLGSRASLKHRDQDEHGGRDAWISRVDLVLVSPFILTALYLLFRD